MGGSRQPLAAGSAFASYDRRGASAEVASPGDRSDVDLEQLRIRILKNNAEETFTELNLFEILAAGPLKVRWRWLACAGAICLGGLALSLILPQPWDGQARLLLAGGVGDLSHACYSPDAGSPETPAGRRSLTDNDTRIR